MSSLTGMELQILARVISGLHIGPRPGRKSLVRLRELLPTHLCTLLSEHEGAREIESFARQIGCKWIWLPIEGGSPDALRAATPLGYVRALVQEVGDVPLPKLYLHCSAGIHRTGFMAYLLLRIGGLSSDTAMVKLRELRSLTADGIAGPRQLLAEELISVSHHDLMAAPRYDPESSGGL